MQGTNKQTVARTEQVVGTTLMIPVSLWRKLRILATERRVSAQSIWIEAITRYLESA